MGQTDFSKEIVNWARKNLKEQWQHDLLTDVAGGVILTAEYVDEIADRAVEAAFAPDECWFQPKRRHTPGEKRSFSGEDFGIRNSSERPVKLIEIVHDSGVNRLQGGQSIEIKPCGLTVIFGKNGSGKSGYARILKKFAASRGDNRILPNALASVMVDPKASISFLEGDELRKAEWTGSENFVDSSFQRVRVYDSTSARSLLVDEQEIAYSPTQIKVLSRFAEALSEVKVEIDGRLKRLELREKQIDVLGIEQFDIFLNDLKLLEPKPAKEAIEGIQEFSKSQEEELEHLKEQFARLKLDSKEVLLKRIQTRKLSIRAERARAEQIASVLQKLTPSDAAKARNELEQAKKSLGEVQNSLGDADRLGICITENWPRLWEAAGEFFALLPVFHEQYAPEVAKWKACPVCQQDLDSNSKDRLLAFERVAKGEANQRLRSAEATQEAVEEALKGIRGHFEIAIPLRSRTFVEDLEVSGDLSDDIRKTFTEFYSSAESAFAATERELSGSGAGTADSEDSFSSSEGVATATNKIAGNFKEFNRALGLSEDKLEREERELRSTDLTDGEKDSLGGRIATLEYLRAAAKNIMVLREGHDARLLKAAHEAASKKCNARTATNLVKKLSDDFIGEISNRFTVELDELGFDLSIPVKLELAKTSKGISYIKPQYNSQKSNPMGEILSEGEQRIVSMAGFFADLTGSDDSSCLIFDDPVTSLDHRYRERVARRLVRELSIRQVVVFSHDFAFVQLLEQMLKEENLSRAAEGQSLLPEISEVEIYRRADGAGSLAPVDLKRRKLRKQLGALQEEMRRLEALERNQPDEYPVAGESFLGAVRETWERVVEETLLNSAVVRMDPAVHTQNLRPLTDINEKDLATVELGMTVESRVMRGHSKAGEIAAQDFPKSSVLKVELERLTEFHKSVRKRRQ